MKVKEVIKFECWIDEIRIWQDTYAENVIDIAESELPKTADEYDWDWYDLPNNSKDLIRDIKIIIEFFTEDAMPEHDVPIVRFSKWESDLYYETYKRCNECLECHHFSNGCDGDSEPCEAFEYPY